MLPESENREPLPLLERRAAHCLRCGYQWFPRVETPVSCPHCFSKLWNTPRAQRRAGKPAPTRKGKARGLPFNPTTGSKAAIARFGVKPDNDATAAASDKGK